MAKLNKAEKFVRRQVDLGKTRNGVREAIFDKLGTWNFPPEYENALATQDILFDERERLGRERMKKLTEYDPLDDALDEIGQMAEAEQAARVTMNGTPSEKCFVCQGHCQCEIVHLNPLNLQIPKIPKPGTQEYEATIAFFRADIESNYAYSNMIDLVKKKLESEGKDFHEEFEKWKKEKSNQDKVRNSIMCYDCGAVAKLDENSTGYCEKCDSANVNKR